MRVLGISGSLRRESHNTALLRLAAKRMPEGSELVELDLLDAIPPFNADLEDPSIELPPAVRLLNAELSRADAVLVATPEYNRSIPGALKNAIDWASRPTGASALSALPVAVVGASTGRFGAAWSQAETRKVLAASGSRVVEDELRIAKATEHYENGELTLASQQERQLDDLLEALLEEAAAAKTGKSDV